MAIKKQHPSSFRDPSGYVFIDKGVIKRVINPVYFKEYNSLTSSGFFKALIKNKILIPHEEVSVTEKQIIIQPEQIPFVTFPYEWCFNQYKESALLTLKIQKYALEHNYSLKDASAFNITFHNGKAVFIDTLSFDFYNKNEPWRAYKQFITHFFGPLVLAYYHGAEILKLMSSFMDGIPVKMLSSMLPFKTRLNPFLYSNIHLLAKFEDKYSQDYKKKIKLNTLTKKAQLNIIESLYNYIKKLSLKENSEWKNYYDKTNYSNEAFNNKKDIINSWVKNLNGKTLIDVGGNDGTFVRALNDKPKQALVCDIDNNAVDVNYEIIKKKKERHIIPFVLDVLNPSAAIGFANKERSSFLERIAEYAPDVTFALAIIHHMTLSGNVSFRMSAKFFASFSKYLVIEFPKRNDSWVQRLLNTKGDFKNHFDFYNIDVFERNYLDYFEMIEKVHIKNSERIMYLFKVKK